MQVISTSVDGVKVLCPKRFEDNRGTFMELWNEDALFKANINDTFVQDNLSTSQKGVLRGVHTQMRFPQSKIVVCLQGEIFDVVVDCRIDSPSFGKWHGEFLSGNNHKQLYIPTGIAHGFLTLNDAMVYMKVSTHYIPGDEIGFLWNDSEIGIDWPNLDDIKLIFADKDLKWVNFKSMIHELSKLKQKT